MVAIELAAPAAGVVSMAYLWQEGYYIGGMIVLLTAVGMWYLKVQR